MKNLIKLAAVAAMSTSAATASAELAEVQYKPFPGISARYFVFGYTPDGGDFVDLTGYEIVSSRAHINFTPDPGTNAKNMVAQMVVPVLDAQSEFYEVLGSDLIETTPGVWQFDIPANDLYDGIIRTGSFTVDCYGQDPITGDPTSIAGTFSDDSGFFFTVNVPEPMSGAMAAVGMMLLRRRR